MKIGRGYLLILICYVFSGLNSVLAESRLPGSSFHDWAGFVDTVRLADGSLLSEYMARTFSGRVEGAMLALSFLPRFECTPTISLRVPRTFTGVDADPVLEISIDGVRQNFRGYVDANGDGKYLAYSLVASAEKLISLRQTIDVSSRVRIRILPASAAQEDVNSVVSAASTDTDSIIFSLIGSQRTALAVQNHCKGHTPVAYEPRQPNVASQ